MIGFQTNNLFLDFSNTKFNCPYCGKEYDDVNDKYLDRCNKNKHFNTRVSCLCGNRFYLTVDYKSDFVTYKL